ncbi:MULTISPECIES: hypothetical protein [Bacillus]|uniref:hypothetical protein n=1 Tax=Bacillus TaxID=1386 RepID=UPI00273E1494|nr:hypothetical protein [Bacillus sp. MMSF_3328]
MLKAENRIPHNYNNEKVTNWILKNADTLSRETDFSSNGNFCNSCYTYERENGKGYLVEFQGKEEKYFDYLYRIDIEELFEGIPNLTFEEKEELEEAAQIWVYYCPFCKEWAVDGAHI